MFICNWLRVALFVLLCLTRCACGGCLFGSWLCCLGCFVVCGLILFGCCLFWICWLWMIWMWFWLLFVSVFCFVVLVVLDLIWFVRACWLLVLLRCFVGGILVNEVYLGCRFLSCLCLKICVNSVVFGLILWFVLFVLVILRCLMLFCVDWFCFLVTVSCFLLVIFGVGVSLCSFAFRLFD